MLPTMAGAGTSECLMSFNLEEVSLLKSDRAEGIQGANKGTSHQER